jgi:hypothetical protein
MFEDKNKRSGLIDLSQNKELKPEDIPVHTMLKDLEELEHPEKTSSLPPKKTFFSPVKDNLSDVQKTSPFLTQNKESRPAIIDASRLKISEGGKPPEVPAPKVSFPETKKDLFIPPTQEIPASFKKKSDTVSSIGKLIAAVIIVLMIIAMGAGGYYFWITRQSTSKVVVTPEPQPEPVPQPAPEPQPEPTPKFVAGEINLLKIDTTAASADTIKEILLTYSKDVADSKIAMPVEFAIVDLQNNPITFQDFAKKIGIVFSPALSANLDKAFTLFIYNDNGDSRLGLGINSKNAKRLKSLLSLEEKTLQKELGPLFLVSQYTLDNGTFETSNYNDNEIRYLNFSTPKNLSIDYSIMGNLYIATSKLTLRSMIDYLKSNSALESKANRIDFARLKENIKTCVPSIIAPGASGAGILYQYTITGKENDLCAVKVKALIYTPDPKLKNKEMVCKLPIDTTYDDLSKSASSFCTGDLAAIY